MNCHQTTERMDAFLAGELSAEQAREFTEHLSRCPICREEVAYLEGLLTEARDLPRSVEPAADLWPGVLNRIEPAFRPTRGSYTPLRRPAFWTPVLAAAAVVALLVVMSGPRLDRTGEDIRRLAGLEPAQAVELEFVHLIAHLQADVASAVDHSVVSDRTLSDGLREVEQAIADTRAAVEAHPEDPRLQRRLASSYGTKVDLLRWTTSFSGGVDVLY
jgi:predicted anti-sigma-YlaC factor YlaD